MQTIFYAPVISCGLRESHDIEGKTGNDGAMPRAILSDPLRAKNREKLQGQFARMPALVPIPITACNTGKWSEKNI
jgi:hypothetical protein